MQYQILSLRLTQASEREDFSVCAMSQPGATHWHCRVPNTPNPPHAHNTHKHNLTAKATGYK